jgi:hypothetical protein
MPDNILILPIPIGLSNLIGDIIGHDFLSQTETIVGLFRSPNAVQSPERTFLHGVLRERQGSYDDIVVRHFWGRS